MTPDGAVDEPMPDWQVAELLRRLAEDDANPGDAIPWEELKAEPLARR